MKKGVKWLLLIVAAVFVLFVGVLLLSIFPMLTMNPAETGQIIDSNVYAVRNKMNTVYFIKTDSGYIIIDAGSDYKKLETLLREIKIDKNDVRWVFLTHSDYDHVDGLALFQNAEIYMSEDELQMIDGTIKRNFFGKNKIPEGVDINKIIHLQDGQELLFNGIKIKCIKAPGHTNGSMAYLVDGQYLFTGDAFKYKNGTISIHPFTMDAGIAEKTIEKLNRIISDNFIVLTAHYGLYYTIDKLY